MLPSHYNSQDCSVARALEIVGERWTLLIIREALHGRRAFDEFESSLGIASNTLAKRLDGLVENGILRRSDDPSDKRRKIYNLTPKGERLHLVIEALREWGDEHATLRRPPASYSHLSCGGDIEISLRCQKCAADLGTNELKRSEHRPLRI